MGAKKPHHAAAALPPTGYRRPEHLDLGALHVRVVGEDGEDFGVYDFSAVQAPAALMRDLVAAFAKASGQGGRWRSQKTIDSAAVQLRRFARDIATEGVGASGAGDISAEVWWSWQARVQSSSRWPGQINLVRALLREVDGLPDTTIRALAGRIPKPKKRTYDAYSRSEFRRIRASAWRTVRAAARRIDTNLYFLEQYRAGAEPEGAPQVQGHGRSWTRGELLDEISKRGRFQVHDYGLFPAREHAQQILGVSGKRGLSRALFITQPELFAVMVLFVCERGYNASVLDGLTVDGLRADDQKDDPPVYIADLDKPRRGAHSRFFSNAFSGKQALLWEMAVAVTQTCRDTAAALGHPTAKLLIAGEGKGSTADPSGVFRTDWTQPWTVAGSWQKLAGVTGDDGQPLVPTLRRLRLTEQVISNRSRQNSDAVSEQVYRQPDPQMHEQAASAVVHGLEEAVAHARDTVKMQVWDRSTLADAKSRPASTAAELTLSADQVTGVADGSLDTAAGACIDFHQSPFSPAGAPCTASFLSCFACPNAIATPRHLPRIVALHDTLQDLASVVTEAVWISDYRPHLLRIQALLREKTTEQEVAQARASVTSQQRETIGLLLSRRLDV